LTEHGHLARPVANNWSEGTPGEHLFGDSYSDELFATRKEAEQAIYDFFWDAFKKDKFTLPFTVTPRFTVVELFGFEGE
jgi:hypothetical protein